MSTTAQAPPSPSGSAKPKPKLAILDDYANIAEPYFAHLSARLDEIRSFPSTLHAQTSGPELVERLRDFAIVSTMRERTAFPRSILEQLPKLKVLLTTGMKNASIDGVACKELGIVLAGTTKPKPKSKPGIESLSLSSSAAPGPPSGSDATNEQTWALILGLAKNVARDDYAVKNVEGAWQTGLCVGLAGKTLGLLGLGRLGVQCAVTGMMGFGMRVLCWSTSLTQDKADELAEGKGLPKGSFKVAGSKLELFEQADVVSLHYVLSERSRGMVGEKELRAMKKSAMLVNTSRGPLIDEAALLKVLEEGKIMGVGLDVFNIEPLPADSPWRSNKWGTEGRSQVLLSPHMGYVEEKTMHGWYELTAENVERWLDGKEVMNQFNVS